MVRSTFKRERYGRTDPSTRPRKKRRFTGPSAGALAALRRRGRSLGLRNLRTGGLLGVEKKFHDGGGGAGRTVPYSPNWTFCMLDPTAVLCLNGVPQGDGPSDRDGMEIAMLSLEVVGHIKFDQSSAAALIPWYGVSVFIAIVLDTQTNGVQMLSQDCYYVPTPASAPVLTQPFRVIANARRFKVLGTRLLHLKPSVMTTGAYYSWNGDHVPFKFFINLKGIKTRYVAGTTTGYCNTITDNSIHFVGNCDYDGLNPYIEYQFRLRYVG